MATAMRSPYVPGDELSLTTSGDGIQQVTILEAMIDPTLSCVSVVRLHSRPNERYILKLYDRRFADQVREDENAGPWTNALEDDYHQYVNSGAAKKVFRLWHTESRRDGTITTIRAQDSMEVEALLQFECRQTFITEKHAYDLMKSIQGIYVPRIICEVVLQIPDCSIRSKSLREYIDVPGLLMQLVEGFSLADLDEHTSPEHRKAICQQAMNISNTVCEDFGICNTDAQLRNFIVQQYEGLEVPQIMMIDFGECIFRDECKSERDFRRQQANVGPEWFLGWTMQRAFGPHYQFVGSEFYDRLNEEFKGEFGEQELHWPNPAPSVFWACFEKCIEGWRSFLTPYKRL